MPPLRLRLVTAFVMNVKKISYAWGLWIFGGYFATRLLVVILCTVSLDRIFEVNKSDLSLFEACAEIFGEILAAAVAWILIKKYYEVKTDNLGKSALGLISTSRCHVMGSILGGFILASSIISLEFLFPTSTAGGASVFDKFTMNGVAIRYSWLVVGILVAPFVEELLFRGVVFSIIKSHLNDICGAIVSVMAFMLVHVTQIGHDWKSALAIFALGMTCATVRVKGMSLWLAVSVHASYNACLTLWSVIYPY